MHLPVAAACSDGDACTAGDTCAKGKCIAGKALACYDGNVCTDDTCGKAQGCVFLANAATCTDGDVCTLGDGCSGGACAHLGKNPCSDGEPCTTDACDPSSGLCSHQPAASCHRSACLKTADCAKGLVCATAIASCVQCTHASQCAPGQACQSGVCIEGKACASFVPCKPLGMVCDNTTGSCVQCLQDGDCGVGKVCQGQRCAPKVACNTDADCPAVCHLQLKVCADCNAPGDCTGGTCGGDHMCRPGHTGSAQCAGGNLFSPAPGHQGYLPTICDDGNICTDSGCALPAGCGQSANAAACSDGDVCTAGDGCVGGTCAAGKGNACDDGKPCTLDGCAAGSGDCSHQVVEGPCSDGNACTLGEVCTGGACKSGKALVCDDGNVCTSDSCDVKAGCDFAGNTLPCDAGLCTTGDVCKAAVCVSSAQKRVWEAVALGDKATVVRGVVATADGFYAAVSYGSASQPDGGGLWRLDGQGKVVWKVEPSLGAGGMITAVAVVGGGAVVVGGRCVNGKCYQWLGKYSDKGTELANITFAEGTSYTGRWNAVAAVPSGGVVLVGRQVYDPGTGQEQGMVESLDTDLKLKWFRFVGGAANDALNAVAIAGGDFVAAGWSSTANNGNDGLVVRVTSAGVVVWERTFGGAGKDEFRSVVVMANGDLSLAGVTGSKGKGGDDGWYVRLVGIGEMADNRTLGSIGADEFLAAIEGSAGGVTLAGRTQGKGTATQGWLVDLDAWGNVAYQRTSGGAFGEDGFHALAAYGGGLLAAGTQVDFAGLSSAAFVRTDSWGHTSCSAAKGCLDLGPSDCDDGNSCTLDGCDGGACNHTPTTFALPCAGGYCAGATCVPPASSCLALQKAALGVRSGVFQLDPDGSDGPGAPFAAWCDQSNHDGGWTLVLKSAPSTQLFTYESSLWLSSAVLAADQAGFDASEAKLASYASIPLKEVRVGLRSGGVMRSLTFGAQGPSLLALMTNGAASSLSVAAWASLVPTLSTLQFDNIQQGLNPKTSLSSRVRIGAAFHCCGQTPGAAIGLGCSLGAGSAWSIVGGSRDGTYWAMVPAFGFVFVR